MKNINLRVVLLLAVGLAALTQVARGERPTWARKATAFELACIEKSEFAKCKPLRIPSPDNKSSVVISYEKVNNMMNALVRLATPGSGIREIGVPGCNGKDELLWSPNSKAFFINGSCGSSISGFVVSVYQVDSVNTDVSLDFTQKAMQDMVKSFPPCKALNHDSKECKTMESDKEYYNMSGIDWPADSSSIIVMSEIPNTPRYGGIMGQLMGYELQVPTGNIVSRLNARQLKAKWQKSMAWKLWIPGPPEYQ